MALFPVPATPPRSHNQWHTTSPSGSSTPSTPPALLTAEDVARVLRTSRRAVYVMLERGQLPGVIRIGRRVLIRQDDLLDWLDQKRTPSSGETR